jgi:hypothetical protein
MIVVVAAVVVMTPIIRLSAAIIAPGFIPSVVPTSLDGRWSRRVGFGLVAVAPLDELVELSPVQPDGQ